MPRNLINKELILVQVMAWCRQQQAITWDNVEPVPERHKELM